MTEERLQEIEALTRPNSSRPGLPITVAYALTELVAEVRRLRDLLCGPAIAAMPQDLLRERQLRQAHLLANAGMFGVPKAETFDKALPESAEPNPDFAPFSPSPPA